MSLILGLLSRTWRINGTSDLTPPSGDVTFFAHIEEPHHVGSVQEVDLASQTIYSIVGNAGDAVRQCSSSLKDPRIFGFAQIGARVQIPKNLLCATFRFSRRSCAC